jgi:hypothetical protein
LVAQEILQLLATLGLTVKDHNAFAGAVTGLTSVSADILNALDGAGVQTINLASPAGVVGA